MLAHHPISTPPQNVQGSTGGSLRTAGHQALLHFGSALAGLTVDIRRWRWQDIGAPRQALERLRYEIYVAEQRKSLPQAIHNERRLPDPHDHSANHFTAHAADGSLIGCVRLHISPHVPPGVQELLGLGEFTAKYDKPFGYVSKLMVRKNVRGAGIAMSFMRAMGDFAMDAPIHGEVAFFHCHPKLVPIYEAVGLRRFGTPFVDADVGPQVPMLNIAGDVRHFERLRSPLAATARRFRIPEERLERLVDLLPATQGGVT